MKIRNEFCEMDITEPLISDYRKWEVKKSGIQFGFNKLRKWSGIGWLRYPEVEKYKAGYILHHRELIKRVAAQNRIPAYLLAGVAYAEATGKPDYAKIGIWEARIWAQQHPSILSRYRGLHTPPENTSAGIVAIQLRVAAQMVDTPALPGGGGSLQKRMSLSYQQQGEMMGCLLGSDRFNLDVAAKYLYALILYDYPDADTEHLTDEQVILAGSRYNRGTDRAKEDFIRSIHTKAVTNSSDPNYGIRDWTSYGRALLDHRKRVEALLDGRRK